MPDKRLDRWRNAGASEAAQRSAVAKAIGKHLKFKFAGVATEPLPEKMAGLLDELKRRRAQKRDDG
jgi:hypothetical protein